MCLCSWGRKLNLQRFKQPNCRTKLDHIWCWSIMLITFLSNGVVWKRRNTMSEDCAACNRALTDGRVISQLQYSQISSGGLKTRSHLYQISHRACTATEYIIFAVLKVHTKQGWNIKVTRGTILKTKLERIQPHFLRLEWVMYLLVI